MVGLRGVRPKFTTPGRQLDSDLQLLIVISVTFAVISVVISVILVISVDRLTGEEPNSAYCS